MLGQACTAILAAAPSMVGISPGTGSKPFLEGSLHFIGERGKQNSWLVTLSRQLMGSGPGPESGVKNNLSDTEDLLHNEHSYSLVCI